MFLGEKWSSEKKYYRDNNIKIEKCNAYISESKEGNIEGKKIYATTGLDIYLYNPPELIIGENKENNNFIKNTNRENLGNEDVEKIKYELARVKEENKDLEDKLYNLNILLQKTQQGIDKYNQQLVRALEQKRKAEENSSIFLELQKKIQGENEALIEEINLLNMEKEKFQSIINSYVDEIKFLKEEIKRVNLDLSKKEMTIEEYSGLNAELALLREEKESSEVKIKEYIDEINLLKDEINNITKELIIKDRKIQEEIDLKIGVENKNKIIIEENLLIKKELALLIEENKRINTELEIEKNKSVMEKLLRKRT